ncbi:MAG TPA: DUF3618 domain-containing protein [Rugosimonospora sp.]
MTGKGGPDPSSDGAAAMDGATLSSLGLDHRRALLRAEIEQTRAALGETVGALAAKADVKARAHDKAGEVKARIQRTARGVAHDRYSDLAYRVGRARERISGTAGSRLPLVAGAAGLVLLLAGLAGLAAWRRRG